jgi:hypothetical protein
MPGASRPSTVPILFLALFTAENELLAMRYYIIIILEWNSVGLHRKDGKEYAATALRT